MAQLENQTQTQGEGNPQTTEEYLKLLTAQLQDIKQSLLEQLQQDVRQLESQKSRLNQEIEQLKSEQQSAEQIARTQQLAQILATQLQEELRQQQLNFLAANPSELNGEQDENTYQLLAALNSTLTSTLRALQQDINSYQSNFSQQLSRMQSLEQQGEAILEALVTRIRQQLQETYRKERTPAASRGNPRRPGSSINHSSQQPPADEPAPTTPPPTTPSPQAANFKLGVILVLISSLMFSLQNIVVRVLLREQNIFGLFKVGGFITPSPGNSLFILLLRMIIVAPLMAFVVAPLFYKNTWRDIKHLGQKSQFGRLISVIVSGFFLFLSQFFIYIALGNISTGVATTIFFVYPTITILLSWLIFRDKPTFLLVLATISIYIGGFLTIPSFNAAARGNVGLGVTTAILSGLAFAVYIVLIKVSRMHPIPFSVVNFSTILFLAAIVLPFFGFQVKPTMWTSLLIGTLVLATTTLCGYLFTNMGVPLIGPPLASVVSASGPALTTILAFLIIQEKLQLYQILGVVLVTVWVIGISAQNLKPKTPPSQPAATK